MVGGGTALGTGTTGLLAFSATASSYLGPISSSGQQNPYLDAELSVIAVEVAEHVR